MGALRRGTVVVVAPLVVAVVVPFVMLGGTLATAFDCLQASLVDGGEGHSIAVQSDGTVWSWGRNNQGQLGDATTTNRSIPVEVSGPAGVTAVVGGGQHSLAIGGDGTTWAWGANSHGQLGDGTTTNRTSPVQIAGVTGTAAIAAGLFHSLAVSSGGVWGWGDNTFGQVGDGTTTDRSAPVQMSGLTGITAVAAGVYHSLALRDDGTVWAWGRNDYGQLGDGTTTARSTAVQVSGLTGVTEIAGGAYFSLARRSDGTVWAWGDNGFGQLGDGTTTNRSTAVQVGGLGSATAVAASYYASAALGADGTVSAWGRNNYGELGDGTTTDRGTPGRVGGLAGVTALAAGGYHLLAIDVTGSAWAWGRNNQGQLGDGGTVDRSTPTRISCALPLPSPTEFPSATPSDECTSTVSDSYSGSAHVKVATAQPDAETVWVCLRADAGTTLGTGGKFIVVSPGGGGLAPAVDGNASACASTSGNTVPGPHPIVYGVVGEPSDLAHATYALDAYAAPGTAWVCVGVSTAAGTQQVRVVVTASAPTGPTVTFVPDPPDGAQASPPLNTAPSSGACHAAATGTTADYLATRTAGSSAWLASWQENAHRVHLCVRADGAVSAGGRITVDTGASTLAPVVTPGSNAAVCAVNVVSQSGVVPFSVQRSSVTNPASVCVTVSDTTFTLTAGVAGGTPTPVVTWTPDSDTAG